MNQHLKWAANCSIMKVFKRGCIMSKHNIYKMSFSRVYSLYISKAEKKGRTKDEVDEIIYVF